MLRICLITLAGLALVAAALVLLLPAGLALEASQSLAVGAERVLRERQSDQPGNEDRPDLLVIALDGVDRRLLYQMLRDGELPGLASLLGAEGNAFPHAHFDERYTSVLPSSTAPAWAAAFTGRPPAQNGVTGNEYFVRAEARFELPVGVTVDGNATALGTYNDGYFNKLLQVPTVYQQLRQREPDILIWVALQHIFAGADRLILSDDSVLFSGLQATLARLFMRQLSPEQTRALTAELDREIFEQTLESLARHPAPDVLTLYLPGTDKIAHNSPAGPNPARRHYLREQLDDLFARLARQLRASAALENRYVVVVSDHGHTAVKHDPRHSLDRSDKDGPPAILKKTGFRLRPFQREVADDTVFDTVLAYQGAMAYLYVADRSSCPPDQPGQTCDWQRPARYEQDVLALAEQFHHNNRDGALVPALQGTLDMVLVRRAGAPFEVYLGAGRTQPLAAWLQANPRPRYLAMPERMRALAVGPYGDRAGDIILVANNGNVDSPEQRYYFAAMYRSWHGSPSAQDGELPLILAHPGFSNEQLRRRADAVLAADAGQQQLTPLLLNLRYGGRSE